MCDESHPVELWRTAVHNLIQQFYTNPEDSIPTQREISFLSNVVNINVYDSKVNKLVLLTVTQNSAQDYLQNKIQETISNVLVNLLHTPIQLFINVDEQSQDDPIVTIEMIEQWCNTNVSSADSIQAVNFTTHPITNTENMGDAPNAANDIDNTVVSPVGTDDTNTDHSYTASSQNSLPQQTLRNSYTEDSQHFEPYETPHDLSQMNAPMAGQPISSQGHIPPQEINQQNQYINQQANQYQNYQQQYNQPQQYPHNTTVAGQPNMAHGYTQNLQFDNANATQQPSQISQSGQQLQQPQTDMSEQTSQSQAQPQHFGQQRPQQQAATTGEQVPEHIYNTPRPNSAGGYAMNLNSAADFTNFIPSEDNRFALSSAISVAEHNSSDYNPLFIYGKSGLGKTHLLNAIGNEAHKLFPAKKILYVTSEEFTNDFIDSLQKGGHFSSSDGQVTAFKRRYRNVDVLLIDDIQFLSGKEETLEQFFHTFNALYNANKQIVIASDVAPKNLKGFQERLISRFEQGLLADIKPPSIEARIAILRMKTKTNDYNIPDEVLEFIASQIKDNVRELEGALNRINAQTNLQKQKITIATAETILHDFINSNNNISPSQIITRTAQYFNITFNDIVSTNRSRNIALARQIAMYIIREMTSLPVTSIGEMFGGRDHTTVLHSYNKIADKMQNDTEIYKYVHDLTNDIKQHD